MKRNFLFYFIVVIFSPSIIISAYICCHSSMSLYRRLAVLSFVWRKKKPHSEINNQPNKMNTKWIDLKQMHDAVDDGRWSIMRWQRCRQQWQQWMAIKTSSIKSDPFGFTRSFRLLFQYFALRFAARNKINSVSLLLWFSYFYRTSIQFLFRSSFHVNGTVCCTRYARRTAVMAACVYLFASLRNRLNITCILLAWSSGNNEATHIRRWCWSILVAFTSTLLPLHLLLAFVYLFIMFRTLWLYQYIY